MRIFETRRFAAFAAENDIEDEQLVMAVEEIEAGKADADLGGGVYKQRVARKGHGKRGSFRTIVLLKRGDKAFFVDGFAKSDKANISRLEEKRFKVQAKLYLTFSDEDIATEVAMKNLRRIL